MEMTRKSAIYALAVAVLMGTMAVAALADDQGRDMRDWYSFGAAPQEQGVEQSSAASAGEIREPMETGAVPDQTGSYDLNSNSSGIGQAVESAGETYRPGVDTP